MIGLTDASAPMSKLRMARQASNCGQLWEPAQPITEANIKMPETKIAPRRPSIHCFRHWCGVCEEEGITDGVEFDGVGCLLKHFLVSVMVVDKEGEKQRETKIGCLTTRRFTLYRYTTLLFAKCI